MLENHYYITGDRQKKPELNKNETVVYYVEVFPLFLPY